MRAGAKEIKEQIEYLKNPPYSISKTSKCSPQEGGGASFSTDHFRTETKYFKSTQDY